MCRTTVRVSVHTLFFKKFLKRPFQIASIIPSSKALVERVASKMDFSQPRVIAQYGPGRKDIRARLHDGCVRIHTCFCSNWTSVFARDLDGVRRRRACTCDSWRCGL